MGLRLLQRLPTLAALASALHCASAAGGARARLCETAKRELTGAVKLQQVVGGDGGSSHLAKTLQHLEDCALGRQRLHCLVASAYQQLHDHANAARHYEQARKVGRKALNADQLVNFMSSRMVLGEYRKAESCGRALLKLEQSFESHSQFGKVLVYQRKTAEAHHVRTR